ncbi:MAG: S41 family peptidase [Chloroflexi bacterium]|nr:S41 family peptidase [Chloroflexota bacterium]
MQKWNWRAASAVLLLMTIAFGAGFAARDASIADAQDSTNLPILAEVQNLLREHYVRDLPDEKEMEYAAIRGYLGALDDRFTFFIDPPVAQSESDALAGRFGGIGVDVKRNEEGLIELIPYPDSPAERAGVRIGDILLDVNDGQLQVGERLDVIRQMLRGEIVEGEENGVTILVIGPGETEPREYFILFEEIRVPSVIWRVLPEDPQIGYIQIKSFTSLTPEEVEEAANSLKGITELVLDLRDNFGGLLQESIEVADMFLNDGLILIEEDREGERSREAIDGGPITEIPVYILTNSQTASAAEVVVGALRDNDRATVVGQTTTGKGSVQFIFGLSDGSSVHITAAIWFTPDKTPIDGVGIEPDIPMIPDENGRDVELGEAIRRIQAMRVTDK